MPLQEILLISVVGLKTFRKPQLYQETNSHHLLFLLYHLKETEKYKEYRNFKKRKKGYISKHWEELAEGISNIFIAYLKINFHIVVKLFDEE